MQIDNLVNEKLPTDTELKRVEIFVLHHSQIEPTKRCLWSLIKNTYWPYKISVINTHMYKKGIISKIYNKLIEESTCDYIAFVCSDAEVGSGWLDSIMKQYKDEYGCVVPLTRPAVNEAMDATPNSGLIQLGYDAISISVSVFRKKYITDIGGFNEKFYLWGHDVDLLKRLESKGLKLMLDTSVTAEHAIGTTTKLLFTKEELEIVDEYNKSL